MLLKPKISFQFLVSIMLCIIGCIGPGTTNSQDSSWQEDFGISERTLLSEGRNDFFILEPGFQLTLESPTEKLVITVLNETKKVDGVITPLLKHRRY